MADTATKSLEQILERVIQTSDQVNTIASASEQQSATSIEIAINTEQMNKIAGETAENMKAMLLASNEVTLLSEELTSLIEALKKKA